MAEPYRDFRQGVWRYREEDYGFAAIFPLVDSAYRWMLRKIQEVRLQSSMAHISGDIPSRIDPLPRIEDAVKILAHDKWGMRTIGESLTDWLRDGRVWNFAPPPASTHREPTE